MITITEALIEVIRQMKSEEPNFENSSIRIFIEGEEISDDSLGIGFDVRPPNDTDSVFEQDGVKILIDQESAEILVGATLDFEDGYLTIHFPQMTN